MMEHDLKGVVTIKNKGLNLLKLLMLAFLGSIVTILLVSGELAYAAGSGSVPLPPSNLTPPPGGGNLIVSIHPLTPGQPLYITGSVDGLTYNVSVPALAFATETDPLELVVTSCSLQSLGNAGFNGYTPYACIGVYVVDLVTGQALSGPYSPTISIQLSGTTITPPLSNILAQYIFSNSSWTRITGNTTGAVTISESSPDYYILLAQNTTPVSTVPSATPSTGKPFLGEEIAAGILILAGLVGILLVARQRRKSAE
jgi:hypothetical protein